MIPGRSGRDRTGQVTFLVVGAVFALWAGTAPGYWIFTVNIGLVLAISTLGLMVVVGWVREVSLAHAGLTGAAAFVAAFALRSGDGLEAPFLLGACLSVGAAVVLSLLIAVATSRLSGIYIIVLTLAVQLTVQKTIFTDTRLIQTDAQHPVPRPALFGVSLAGDRAYFYFTLVVLGAVVIFLARFRKSRFGRGLLLVGADAQAAAAVGVSPWRAKILAFAIAGCCAGLAGTLTAPLYETPPATFAYNWFVSLLWLSVPVLAGFESLLAVVLVAVGYLVVPQALEPYNVSPFGLGAAGLLGGTALGARGISGLVLDRLRLRRRAQSRTEPTGPVGAAVTRSVSDMALAATIGGNPRYERAIAVLEDYLPPRPQAGDALVATDVSVAFGGVVALHHASITVPAGQLVGLIGHNGAGKTTLFDVLNGLRAPDHGTVELFGADITATRPWERAALGVSRTFQATRLNLDLPVSENLLVGAYPMVSGGVAASVLGLGATRTTTRRAEDAAWAVAELFGIERYWEERTEVLSYGNRRRVEIGRSLMGGPRVLLLDEPSAGLDPTAAATLFSAIRHLHQRVGLPVLLIEHDVKAVLKTCDLVYVLGQGRVMAAGTPDEVIADPTVRAEYLGPDFAGHGAAGTR